MALMPHRYLYGEWTLVDEPRRRIVASNRHRRRHPKAQPVAAPARVIYEPPVKATRKSSLFTRAAQAVRRVLGGRA